jgi:polar amino acid transport system substrate-binding protein
MHRVRRIIALGLFLVGGLVAAAPEAPAQESATLNRVITSGTLRVGMSGNQPPYNVVSRSGDVIGIEADIAAMLAVAMEVDLEIVRRPFPQLMDALVGGEVDIVMSGMAITPQRARRVSFVGPHLLSGRSILTNSRALAAVEETEDFDQSNLKLAALQNSTSERFIARYLPDAQFVPIQDYDEGVQMVINDEVDALVADMFICMLSVLRYPNAGLLTLNEPLTIEPLGIAVPREDRQFHGLIENFVNALEGTGLLMELRQHWLEDGTWIAQLP